MLISKQTNQLCDLVCTDSSTGQMITSGTFHGGKQSEGFAREDSLALG